MLLMTNIAIQSDCLHSRWLCSRDACSDGHVDWKLANKANYRMDLNVPTSLLHLQHHSKVWARWAVVILNSITLPSNKAHVVWKLWEWCKRRTWHLAIIVYERDIVGVSETMRLGVGISEDLTVRFCYDYYGLIIKWFLKYHDLWLNSIQYVVIIMYISPPPAHFIIPLSTVVKLHGKKLSQCIYFSY